MPKSWSWKRNKQVLNKNASTNADFCEESDDGGCLKRPVPGSRTHLEPQSYDATIWGLTHTGAAGFGGSYTGGTSCLAD